MRKTVPLVFGLITFLLLALLLWPSGPQTVPVVVAAADLGAGTTLTPADVQVVEMSAGAAPQDAVGDPAEVVGRTLAVVRFAGEPITPRHLGPAVKLRPDERAVAVKVRADTGLAGLLRPGMKVGVVATLRDTSGNVYAKATVEGLRVLYVPPSFMARPVSAVGGSLTVSQGRGEKGGGLLSPSSAPVPAAGPGDVREGVVVLAASVDPQPVFYETPESVAARAEGKEAQAVSDGTIEIEGEVRYVVPVELLAALNAAGDALTLVLVPEDARPYTSAGFATGELAGTGEEGRP